MRMSKYRAVPTIIDGIRFPSRLQAARYRVLKLLQMAGKISNLRLEVPYNIKVCNVHVCTYIADFVYLENGIEIVEDSKGVMTPIFRLKRKLIKAALGVEIRVTGRSEANL
jgi:hypothetical protein